MASSKDELLVGVLQLTNSNTVKNKKQHEQLLDYLLTYELVSSQPL